MAMLGGECSPCCGGGCLTTATLSLSIADTVGLTPSPQQSPSQYNYPSLHIEAADHPNGIDIPPMPHLSTVHITAPSNARQSPYEPLPESNYDFLLNSIAPGVFSGQRLFLAFSVNKRTRFPRGTIISQITQTVGNQQIPLFDLSLVNYRSGRSFDLVWDNALEEWKDAAYIAQADYAALGRQLIKALPESPGFVLHDFNTSNNDYAGFDTFTWVKQFNNCFQPPLPPMVYDTRIRSQLAAKINAGDSSAVTWDVNYETCTTPPSPITRTFSVLPRWCDTYRSTTTLIARNETPVICHEIKGRYEEDGELKFGKGIFLRQAIEVVAATDNTNVSRHPMAAVVVLDGQLCPSLQIVPPDTPPEELIAAMNCLPNALWPEPDNTSYSIEELNDAGKNNNSAFHAVYFYVPMPVYGSDALLEANLTGGSGYQGTAPRFVRPMAGLVNASLPDTQTISTERYVLDIALTNDQVRQIQDGGSVTLSLSGQEPFGRTLEQFNLGAAVLRAVVSDEDLPALQSLLESVDGAGRPNQTFLGNNTAIRANVPGSTVTVAELP